MSGASWADPYVLDVTGASGSATLDSTPTPHLVVVASENSETSYFAPSAVIDGSRDTAWETNTVLGTPTSITLSNPAATAFVVSDYTLVARNYWGGRAPESFKLEGSDDLSSWTEVDSRTGINTWDGGSGSNNVKTFTLSTPASFKYWKLTVFDTQTSGDILDLGEIYFNGVSNSSGQYFYIRMDNIEEFRHYELVLTNGTASLYTGFNQWAAFTRAYVEEDSIGYYSPYDTVHEFFHSKQGVMVRVQFSTPGTFTFAWTRGASEPVRPYDWFCPTTLTPVAGGSIEYDGIGVYPFYRQRHFIITPTTSDPLSFSSDEPNGYIELYRENGVASYDEYIEYWESDHPLEITPVAGDTYHVVVYPNRVPDGATEFTLTWSTSSVTPPPYTVANDPYTNPFPIVMGAASSGTFDYDNTGATEDDSTRTGKRSIWYSFSVSTTQHLHFSAIPGDADPASVAELAIWTAAGAYANDVNQQQMADGELGMRAAAGVSYLLQLSFPDSLSTSPWDDGGVVTWAKVSVPNDTPDTGLPADPGDGQTQPAAPAFPGYRTTRWYTIVAPSDGAMSIVVEYPSGETGYLAASAWQANGTTYMHDVPTRAIGTTTPEAWIHAVHTGDVVKVKVDTARAGVVLRWGMDTTPEVVGDWHPTDYNRHFTWNNGGTPAYFPEGSIDWPVGSTDAFDNLFEQYIGYGNSISDSYYRLDGGHVDTSPMVETWPRTVDGEGAAPGGVVSRTSHITHVGFGGHSLWAVDSGTRIDNVTEYAQDLIATRFALKDPIPSDLAAKRTDPWSDLNANPVLMAASRRAFVSAGTIVTDPNLEENELGDELPDDVAPFNFGTWFEANKGRYAIEWSPENPTNKPIFDMFRVTRFSWSKDVHGAGTGAPGYAPPEGWEARLHEVPTGWFPALGGIAPAWVDPEDISAGTEVVAYDAVDWPDTTGPGSGEESSVLYGAAAIGSGYNGLVVQEAAKIQSDIFGGELPETLDSWQQDYAYGLWTNHSGARGLTLSFAEYWPTLAAMTGDPDNVSFSTWPFFHYECYVQVVQAIGRRYPLEYRILRYSENLEPIIPVTPPSTEPGAGYYIIPNPNLDGQADGVDVHFASTT